MSLFAIRKGERRDTWAAFLTLFALIASHSILETARDALFLAKVPATRLPWVFLAIAALSFVVVRFQARATQGLTPRRALSVLTLFAGAVTVGFYSFLHRLGSWGLYFLYVWSGLLVTLVLVHFWALVGDLFTITQAKRLYGFIGVGSVLGAIVGSGVASLLSRVVSPERLLLVAAIGFGLTAAAPFLFTSAPSSPRAPDVAPKLLDTVVSVAKPYAFRVAASLFVATVCLTLADFIFKSTVADHVPKAELGAFLGTVYFSVNVLSLVCQLSLVAWVLRRTSLGSALALLPVLFVMGGLGIAITGGLTAVLAVKAADGALRYSLHRTATELLFLPFGEEARRRVKAFVDVVGQRGGQVLASGAILVFAATGAGPRVIALALVVLACVWVASALALRRPYIELFRTRLRAGRMRHVDEFPELDVASLETLIASLESDNDGEVIAALHVLDRENKAHLIPALILYHPSEQVVVRALAILTRSGRKNFVKTIDRVIDHPSPVVRAATIAARSVLAPDAQKLLMRLSFEESPEVRATIVVNLIASGDFSAAERKERVDALLRSGTPVTKVAFAEAIGRRSASGFDDVLIALAAAREIDVRRAAITAMGRVKSTTLLPLVVAALTDEATRGEAEQVLAAHGTDGFEALLRQFEQVPADAALRWRIPHATTLCNPERAMEALFEWLPKEPDGAVRFQIIRALERLARRHPTLPLDRRAVGDAIDETVGRAYRYLDRRFVLVRGAAKDPARKTPGHDLLRDLLRDKEANAKGRLFRLLGLLHPGDDFAQIYRGLTGTRDLRATSMELIESILREPLRGAVIGLVDDGDDELRLARAGRHHQRLQLDYEALLAHLIEAESEAVKAVTRFHAAELGLAGRFVREGQAA